MNRYPLESPPIDLALSPFSAEVIVAQNGSTELFHLAPATGEQARAEIGTRLTKNSRIAVNPFSRQIWVTVPDSNMVIMLDPSSPEQLLRFDGLNRPSSVAAPTEEGVASVGTSSGLLLINEQGLLQRFFESSIIVDLDVHRETGDVWVITYDEKESEWLIQVVERIYDSWTTRIFQTNSYREISQIAVNPGTEHPGIMLYDGEYHSIVRLDSQENEIGWYYGFTSRLDIAVEQ